MPVVRVIAITILWLTAALPLEAATLVWDASTSPNVAGYKVLYGTQPGVHTTQVDVGNVLTHVLTPPAGQTYYVVVQAYNTLGVSEPSNEIVVTGTTSTNLPPTLNQPANQSGVVGSSATLVLTASDPENGLLNFTATGLPTGLSLNSTTRTISGTLQAAATYNVTVTVSDGTLTASRSFTWTVTPPTSTNQPPTLNQPANQSGTVGSAATLVLTASDPENAPLTFTANGLPAGLSLNSATRTISGTLQTAATYDVTVTVSDGSLSASRSFTWNVTSTPPPPPPADTTAPTVSFTSPSNNETINGKKVQVRVNASDASGIRSVRYSLNTNPLSGEITVAPYQYAWDVSGLSGGTYQLSATALDNAGNAGTATISVTIKGGNGRNSLSVNELELVENDGASNPDIPVNGDFDGDGLSDPGTFSALTGEWRIFFSSIRYEASQAFVWGAESDVPVPADYDGDGRTDLAVYRPSSGLWSIVLSNKGNPSQLDVAWGREDDTPMAFDYDRDGRADLALKRPWGFDILLSSKGYAVSASVK